ncbi:MAG: 16S rRNA (guanine(966)-N(2))-methyltransferase RsmD [Candidatus Obscuribacterales bacterium]|nr:16S rRNA (guanine(966)-N(2))-methyltransferase RsmD [Candidatus Obscuribacterales bacterium]
MRITGGEARGRVITAPPGLEIRPTSSKVRQAFFNILGNKIYGCRFLDLCAGTGLMGIEALSRGAASLISVEVDKTFAKQIQTNLKHLGYADQSEVISTHVERALPLLTEKSFDIIFADPPYKDRLVKKLPNLIGQFNLLDDGVFILEHLKSTTPEVSEDSPLALTSTRNYGQTSISFYQLKSKIAVE